MSRFERKGGVFTIKIVGSFVKTVGKGKESGAWQVLSTLLARLHQQIKKVTSEHLRQKEICQLCILPVSLTIQLFWI